MLCRLSSKGDLEKVKQIFAFDNNENIRADEMEVTNNDVNHGKKPRLVDTNSGGNGRTPLMEAIVEGNDQICNYLIKEEKADLEVRDDDHQTALIYAANYNRTEVLNVLIDNGSNIKAQNRSGYHAAYRAACYGKLDILKMLLAKDRSVIDLKGPNGETPLIVAAIDGRVQVVRHLVHENAKVNLIDLSGKTALQHAMNFEIIEILKNNGGLYFIR